MITAGQNAVVVNGNNLLAIHVHQTTGGQYIDAGISVKVTGGGPAGYTFYANENGTCSFSGTMAVRYGANNSYFYRTATSSIACNNATFGDPIFGTAKACYYK